MKKSVYTTLLTSGLALAMSTQVFAIATIDPNAPDKNITVGNAVTTKLLIAPTSVTEQATTVSTLTKETVEPKAFTGVTPTNQYEIYFTDSANNKVLLETIMVFDQKEYMNSLTKIARPEPYLVIEDKAYVSMKASNPFTAGTADYDNFKSLAEDEYPVIENQITDMSVVNGAFSKLFGGDVSFDTLDNFIYLQDFKTDKMTVAKFDMYAPKTKGSNEYDLLAKVTYTLKGDVTITVPMKQDVAMDPAFYMMQRILLNYENISKNCVVNDGVVYVPVREYAEITGYEVVYLAPSKTVNFKKRNDKFITRYGSDYATKVSNGVSNNFDLESPLYSVDGVGYVPLNFIVNGINS